MFSDDLFNLSSDIHETLCLYIKADSNTFSLCDFFYILGANEIFGGNFQN